MRAAEFDEEKHPRDEHGKWTSDAGSTITPTAKDLKEHFKGLPISNFFNNYHSDTAIELTSPYRSTSERRAEYADIEKASNRDSALRAMDSEKNWGSGWAAATDEWQAAQALGASTSASKTTVGLIKEQGKPLSVTDVAAFKERYNLLQKSLEKNHPSGEVTLYRGVKGPQAKKIEGRTTELGVHGLSSWSDRQYVASEFAGKSGRVLQTNAKVKDIWTTGEHVVANQVVRIADQHGEYVVKTAGKSRTVNVIR